MGSVVNLVTGALSLFNSINETVKLILKIKKDKKIVEELKKDDYAKTEADLTEKLLTMEKASQPAGKSCG